MLLKGLHVYYKWYEKKKVMMPRAHGGYARLYAVYYTKKKNNNNK